MPVFFITPECVHHERLVVTGQLVRHLQASLRVQVGQALWFGDQHQSRYHVRLDEVTTKRVAGEIIDVRTRPETHGVQVTLACAMIKAHRMSWMLQKMTELGVADFVPLLTERTVVQAKAVQYSRVKERWQRIVFEAAQQSERWDVPCLHPPARLNAFLDECEHGDLNLFLWEDEVILRMSHAMRLGTSPKTISILVGPEGGFTTSEVDAAKARGYRPVTLGAQTLRSETAALAALSVVQSEFA